MSSPMVPRPVQMFGWMGCSRLGNFRIWRSDDEDLKEWLGEDEYVIVDSGYDDVSVLNGLDVPDYIHYQSAVRVRHEMVNGKLKRFKVLTSLFRYDRWLQTLCFHAVANITNTVIKSEEP